MTGGKEKGWTLGNIDAMLCLEAPKIKPYIPAMKQKIAEATGIDEEDISIKATTNETMGFVGRQEGVVAYADLENPKSNLASEVLTEDNKVLGTYYVQNRSNVKYNFGAYNTFGIKSAARTYFNTTPDKLTAEQAALLVGMLKGPGVYSPVRYPGVCFGTQKRDRKAMAAKADLDCSLRSPNYVRRGLARYLQSCIIRDEIKKRSLPAVYYQIGWYSYDLDRDGLKYIPTINLYYAAYAEESTEKSMKELQGAFDRQWKGRTPFSGKNAQLLISGMKRSDRYRMMKDMDASEEEIKKAFNTKVPMNVFTWRGSVDTVMTPMDSIKPGHIKAWVGGYYFEHFKYDQVKLGQRQVGFHCKTIYTIVSAIFQQTYGNWTPRGIVQGGNPITLKKALAYSQELLLPAYLINEVGASAVANLTQKMGITTKVPSYPSIALGAYEASVFDMVGAYSAFVNSGTWVEPTMIMRIEDKSGTTIYEKAPKVVKALNSETAYIMVDMLKGVVDGGYAYP
ncbi:hypothetical protein FQR65_LT16254 [Abscondita terminalis]|nr:hypothetical protein FQR65_LT16254 [Abscondita terminalis]